MPPYKKRKFIRGRQIELSLHVKGPKKGRVYQLRISNLKDEWVKEFDLRPSEDWETVAKNDRFKIRRHKKRDLYVVIDRARGDLIILGEGSRSVGQLLTLYRRFRKRLRLKLSQEVTKKSPHEMGVL